MSKITFEYDENKVISAFAFNTGQLIEQLINDRTSHLEDKYKMLEAKLLDYYMRLPAGAIKSEFGGFFGIIRQTGGKI